MTGPAVTLFPEEDEKPAQPTTLFGEPGERMRQSLRLAEDKSPDDAASVLSIAAKTGMAPDVIERNLQVVKRRQTRASFDSAAFRQQSPATANWVGEHPNNAAVAKDDLANLSFIEGITKSLSIGASTGRAQAQQGKLGLNLMASRKEADWLTQNKLDALEREVSREPAGRNWFTNILFRTAQIYGQMAEGVPYALKAGGAGAAAGGTAGVVAGAVGGPVAALTGAGGVIAGFNVGFGGAMLGHMMQMEGGQAYLALKKIRGEDGQALDPVVVETASVGYAVLSGALEVVGFNILAAPFKSAAKKFAGNAARDMLVRPTMRSAMAGFGKQFTTTYAGEVGVEVAQETTNILIEELAKLVSNGQFATIMNDPEQRELAIGRLAETTRQAAAGMLLLGVPGASVNLAADVVRARRATKRGEFYLALGEGVKGSKTFERLPEALQTIVEQATKDGPIENVHIDLEPFQEYFQGKNVDPREVARELWGSTAEYDQAVQTGQAMSIPMAKYATKIAPTEHNAFFARELRRSPDEMNARESDKFLKEIEALKAEPVDPAAREESLTALTKTIADQITATGRFRGSDAETLATQMAAFFTTQGERYGIDPTELFNRYGLQVLSGRAPAGNVDEALAARGLSPAAIATLTAEESQVLAAQPAEGTLEQGGIVLKPGEAWIDWRPTPRNPWAVTDHEGKTLRTFDSVESARRFMAKQKLSLPAPTNKSFNQSAREITAASIAVRQQFDAALSEYHDIGNQINAFPEERRKALIAALRTLPDILHLKQENRGRIRIGADRKISIDLFENADFSTFLHESGHFYLEVLTDLAAESENAAADLATVRAWLGAKESTALTREQHEQFARGVEAYLMEGIAPSIALRRAFFRFKAWLKALYSTLRSLDVQLTPEVRDVFDRMFASDAEIEAAENEAQIVPIFTDAESAGMSETEFAAYRQTVEDAHIQSTDRLRTRLIKESLREQKEWWKEARAETRTEVEAEVSQEPVYRALSILQRGELPDGTTAENAFKLSKSGIVALRGEEFPKRLPRPYVYSAEGGIDPDQAAELLGFTSGDELLQALADAPKREQVIEAETDRRMKAKYGDMLIDGTIAEIAQAEVLGEFREKVIRAELRALRKKAREVKPFVKAEQTEQKAEQQTGRQILAGVPSEEFVRNVAQARLSTVRVRDIKPFLYWVAARKANRKAVELAGKQDYAGAADAQQAHLMNVALYREATRIREEVDGIVEYARKLQKPTIQARIGKAAHGYLDQINKILERFDFSPSTLRENDRRASLAQFIRSMEEQNIAVTIPEEIQNEAFRKPWAEMSYEELVGVKDTLKHLDYLSLRWNKLLKSIEQRTLEEAVDAGVASIEAHASKTLQRKLESRLPKDQPGRKVQAFIGSLRKLSSIIREMDGWQDNGLLWNLLVRPLNSAADDMSLLNQEIGKKLDDLFAPYSTADRLQLERKLEWVPELQTSLTRMGKIMMALNWGTEDNRQKLQAGMELTLGRSVSQSEIDAVLDTLDQRDWNLVKGIWSTFNDYWPQFKALVERMDGIAPEKVEGVSVITKYGEIQGMYFPIAYDDRQSREAHRDVVSQRASQVAAGAAARASTKAGARHERIAGIRRPLRLDSGVILEKLSEVAMDLTHTETLLDVNRILGHKDFESSIMDHYGDQVYKQLLDSVRDIAAGHVPAQSTLDEGLNWARKGSTVAALGWNVLTSLLQPIGLTNSMARIGPKWVGRGLSRWLRDAAHMENTAAWIVGKSKMMSTRVNTQTREIEEIRNQLGTARSRLGMYLDMGLSKATAEKIDLQDLEDSFFWFITRAQLVADIPTWLGAYEKALEANADDEATAIALADQAVIDSQGSGQIKDLAQIQRGSPALKLWMNFFSFFSTTYQLHVEALKKTDPRSVQSVGRMAGDLLLLSVIPVIITHYLRQAVKGGDDDEGLVAALIREELSYLIGMIPLLREIGGVIQGFHGYEGPAGSRLFSEAGKLIQQVQQGDSDRALWKALNNTAGILFHYPAGQVQRTVEGFMVWTENKANPLPLFFGPPRR